MLGQGGGDVMPGIFSHVDVTVRGAISSAITGDVFVPQKHFDRGTTPSSDMVRSSKEGGGLSRLVQTRLLVRHNLNGPVSQSHEKAVSPSGVALPS